MITKKEISGAILQLGLKDKCVCLHSSMKSFGDEVKGGADDIIDSFLDNGCTLLVPTFSYNYILRPPENSRPAQNGYDYDNPLPDWGRDLVFLPENDGLSKSDMGAIPSAVLEYEERIRGNHPICSFTAIGPYAKELVKGQAPMDVYAPLRELALFHGFILLMGVGLNRMTAIHLAEQMAGRNMFIRWANNPQKQVVEAETGGCSEGFGGLEPYITGLDKRVAVGNSLWRAFDTGMFLKKAARVIILKPEITHCGDENCIRCNDAIKGGVVQF